MDPATFNLRTGGANMKLVKFCAVGAFLCCGGTFCFAQEQESPLAEAAESVFFENEQPESLVPAPAADLERPANPGDDDLVIDGGENPFYTSSPSDRNGTVKAADPNDPASLPVGTHQLSPIDQILQQGVVAQYPDGSSSIVWPMQQRADNPTARVMRYGWCGEGLWCNFPAERAAQCAKIQQRLAGHHHLGGCSSGCSTCASGACDSHGTVRNRYTSGASSCDSLAKPCPSCHASNLYGPLNVSSRMVPVEVVPLPSQSSNVAAVPTVVR